MQLSRRTMSGQQPGAAYLGLLCCVSLHWKDIKRRSKCAVKACVMPSHKSRLCYQHEHFFDYRYSMTGNHIDVADIYNEEAPNETVLSVVTWQGDCESLERGLKIERTGYSNSRWSVTREKGVIDVLYDNRPLVPNKQMGCDISRKGWGKKKIRKKQRQRPAGWHGHHPEQKPIKRWSRQTLENTILPDGSMVTVAFD